MKPGGFLILGCLAFVLTEGCSLHKRSPATPVAAARIEHRDVEKEITEKYAGKLGVSPSEIKNIALYRFVDQWEGVPYKYGGNSIRGTDCSGFAAQLYSQVFDKVLPRTSGAMEQTTEGIARDQLKEGDILFFDINGKKSSHVGIYLLNDKFIHASTSKGVIISDLNNSYYRNAFSRGGRL